MAQEIVVGRAEITALNQKQGVGLLAAADLQEKIAAKFEAGYTVTSLLSVQDTQWLCLVAAVSGESKAETKKKGGK